MKLLGKSITCSHLASQDMGKRLLKPLKSSFAGSHWGSLQGKESFCGFSDRFSLANEKQNGESIQCKKPRRQSAHLKMCESRSLEIECTRLKKLVSRPFSLQLENEILTRETCFCS